MVKKMSSPPPPPLAPLPLVLQHGMGLGLIRGFVGVHFSGLGLLALHPGKKIYPPESPESVFGHYVQR
jgi:hypothetical protein